MKQDFETAQTSASNQIVQEIYFKVASGEYKKGDKIPSVRGMAAMRSVSPDTVQRAYSHLEKVSLIETKHGLGTYITDDESWIEHFRLDLLQQKTEAFVREMKQLGVSVPEIISALKSKRSNEKSGKSRIETASKAEKFLADFEKYSTPDENGHYSITFRNDIDYMNEEVWTTLFKADEKWYFHSQGKTWAPLMSKEVVNIIPFVLKYAKAFKCFDDIK